MKFAVLQRRVIEYLNARIHNGDVTERDLARLTGLSQPHIHNLLSGARLLTVNCADQILERTGMSVLDLLEPEELARYSKCRKL
jgi:plasmid maintenance system antidote protein VapI